MARNLKRETAPGRLCGSPVRRTKQEAQPVNTPSRPRTIRLSRIPRVVSYDKLEEWLGKLDVPTEPVAFQNVAQLSLAPNNAHFSQATVTFNTTPVLFTNVDNGPQNVDGPEESRIVIDIGFDGMTVLYDPVQAGVGPAVGDVIALPGLGGHALGSWKSPEGFDVWLRDFLPKEVKNVRTIVYGYDTNLHEANWKSTIYEMAKSMLDSLQSIRDKASRARPIIFVGHSLGGLIIKQALIIVAENKDYKPYRDLLQSCCSVIFFGVPNEGIRFEELIHMVEGKRSEEFVRGLLPDKDTEMSVVLRTLSRDFGRCEKGFGYGTKRGLDILCYYEKQETRISEIDRDQPVSRLLVTESSATYTGVSPKSYNFLPLNGDHRSMVKFRTMTDRGYESVRGKVQEFVEEAVAVHSKSHVFTTEEQGERAFSSSSDDSNSSALECLRSLSFEEIEFRRDNIDAALENTCSWLFEHPKYRDWINEEREDVHNGLLWIKGKPGSGKSTLIKQALQRTEWNTCHNRITVAFFFNARGGQLERTSLGLFRSLLYQLFLQARPLLSEFLPIFLRKRDTLPKGWSWLTNELCDSLRAAITTAQGYSIVMFVDALDECDQQSIAKMVEFFEHLTLSVVSVGCNLNICLSSRHYPNVHIRNSLEIRMEDFNETDISTYARVKLGSITQADDEFVSAIIEKASGVFLWVVLVIAGLSEAKRDGEPISELWNILESIPTGLTNLFLQIITAIPEAERRKTVQVILWVLLAERPLTPTELRFALAFESPYKSQKECEASQSFVKDDGQMERLLRKRTRGLIEVARTEQGTADTVQFIHESVRDFLLQENGLHLVDPSLGEGAISKGHDQLERSCINYVKIEELIVSSMEEDEVQGSPLQREVLTRTYPFLRYSVTSLFEHAAKAENGGVSQAHLLEHFQQSQNYAFESLRRYFDFFGFYRSLRKAQGPQTVLLHFASQYGLFTCVEDLLERGVDANTKGGHFGNALQAASFRGHGQIVQRLLEKGADINAQGGLYGNALQAASYKGHDQIVQRLLGKGADVNAQGGEYGNALLAASFNGHGQIVQRLLEKGADVNAQGGEYSNALLAASFNGHDQIVQRLLEKGADVNAQGGEYGNALQAASFRGHDQIVQQLLEKGSDINTQGGYYGNALQAASSGGHSQIIQRLLEKGADINTQGGFYGNALQAASFRGHGQIIQRLLEKGADINTQGGEYGNALQAASCVGHDQIVQWLLEKGADINTQRGFYGNALQAASFRGHDQIVQRLLEKGADVNAQGGKYGNALQAASLRGHHQIIQRLLEKGADINTQGGEYGNALQAASLRGRGQIIRRLLKKGADINTQGGEYGNALQAASCVGHDQIVQWLLEKGADINTQGGFYGNALQAASFRGHDQIVQRLLEKGADVNAQGGQYGNALQAASLRGHHQIIQRLLEKGADVNAQGGEYSNALLAASLDGHDQAVQRLLEKGAEINTQGGFFYGNALQAASLRGHDQIVQLLLEKGADVNTQEGFYGNALQAASYEGHHQIVQQLLEKGADVNAQGGFYGNALQAASYEGHHQIVQRLLEKGADVNAQGGEYGNALQAASYEGHDRIVQRLLEKGADAEAQGGKYGNALQAASSKGHSQIVQRLQSAVRSQ